jgi:NCAIR mutase (PurE)-related protein
VRGGSAVVAKRIGQVRLSFAPGEARTTVAAVASSYVEKSAATLPPEIDKEIRRNRKPGDEDAAVDPMARAEVRDAITRTSFELLVGFNLTPAQFQYNATR